MKGVVNTSEGTATLAKLDNGQEVAAKTGTSSEYHDITFCGITPQLSVAVWFGDPSNQETIPTDVSAADVFKKFMTAGAVRQANRNVPPGIEPLVQGVLECHVPYRNDVFQLVFQQRELRWKFEQ